MKEYPDARDFFPLALPPTTKKNEPVEGVISLLANFV
jgi:hypothetical protein